MGKLDVVIIGAGVIGLSIAAQLAERLTARDILLLEKNSNYGWELSSRTSEVIHSGIYYPTGSLKAGLCVEGNRSLYDFCAKWSVPYRQSGKVIIARDSRERELLERLYVQGQDNGVKGIELLDARGVKYFEPAIKAEAGLYSPTSGIIDSHGLMRRLEQLARERGVMLAYNNEVVGIEAKAGGYSICYRDSRGTEDTVTASLVMNCAGLAADKVAGKMGIDIDEAGYRLYKCKGQYFAVNNNKASLVSRLVFPASIRELKGSGLPVIKDMTGRLRIGPDANYAPDNCSDYTVNCRSNMGFLSVVASYLPFLTAEDLEPDIAGLRPRLLTPCGSPPRDFIINHEFERGLPGIINIIGIESPGLTCCLSLADMVAEMVTNMIE